MSNIFKKDKIKKRITAAENQGASVCDNSMQNIPNFLNEGMDCLTTQNIKSASNFQPIKSQSEDSGFQKQNERAESWKNKFVILLIISIVLVVALTVTLIWVPVNDSPVMSTGRSLLSCHTETREMEKQNDELNEQIQNLTQENESERREMEKRNDELNEQIKNLTQEHESERREMEIRTDGLNEQIQNLSRERDSASVYVGIYYKKIYWAKIHANRNINLTEASKICTDKNSTLADIYSDEHYNMLMNYFRTDRNVDVWTGMRKQFGNPKAILSDGRTAPFTKPRSYAPAWDTADSRRTYVYLLVRPDVSETDQGVSATWPSYDFHGALCQSL